MPRFATVCCDGSAPLRPHRWIRLLTMRVVIAHEQFVVASTMRASPNAVGARSMRPAFLCAAHFRSGSFRASAQKSLRSNSGCRQARTGATESMPSTMRRVPRCRTFARPSGRLM